MANILVTGGAGFIGSFITDELLSKGHQVTVLDSLDPQVHKTGEPPSYLNKQATFIKGDVGEYDKIKQLLKDHEYVYHEAAAVGVGQSMYEIRKYVQANTYATSVLLEALANEEHNIKKLIVASSMSIYGEGSYKDKDGNIVSPPLRPDEQMAKGDFNMYMPGSTDPLTAVPTSETKPLETNSIYAQTKKDQEEMCLIIGKAYGIPTVALRYFNVYGPRQSLSNPYTGVAAIFLSRIKNNNPPTIYEDGNQSRDFVNVRDIAQANVLAMEKSAADYEILNVGTGRAVTIKEVAEVLTKISGSQVQPKVLNTFRKGDIRHCYPDISKIKSKLGYEPKVSFEDGMKELFQWSKDQDAVDGFSKAEQELKSRGLA